MILTSKNATLLIYRIYKRVYYKIMIKINNNLNIKVK